MQSIPIYDYIFFGTNLRYLQDVEENWKVHGEGRILENIEYFLENLTKLNLQVTLRSSHRLKTIQKNLTSSLENHVLTKEEARELADIVSQIRHTLEAEAQGNIAYIVTDKRLDVRKLTTSIGNLMSPGIYDSIPEIAKYDFSEAGKCIAFERPTAAAFHLLRGTESVLKHFYCSIVKRGRTDMLWGPMIDSLRRRRNSPPKEILENLDSIRRLHRNPTAHPDKRYDIQEVQDLFGLCVDAVNRMVKSSSWEIIPKTSSSNLDKILKTLMSKESKGKGKTDKESCNKGNMDEPSVR